MGDFNNCTLKKNCQYVTCPTRKHKIIDCYGSIPKTYLSSVRAPLGGSDHNTDLLRPTYEQVKPVEKQIQVWVEDSVETLKGCLEGTSWRTL